MKNFDLASVLATQTVISETLVPQEVTWKDENGVDSVYTVFVVSEVSCAASDRIILGDPKYPEAGRFALTIAERIRFSEDGKQRMTAGQASTLKDALAIALVAAVRDFDKAKYPEAEEEAAKV